MCSSKIIKSPYFQAFGGLHRFLNGEIEPVPRECNWQVMNRFGGTCRLNCGGSKSQFIEDEDHPVPPDAFAADLPATEALRHQRQ